jgi:hypothetical protein
MGMTSTGPGRVRWIRILILVLALTASRNNFPLSNSRWCPPSKASPTLSTRTPKESKKLQEVVPSRRSVESTRISCHQSGGAEFPRRPLVAHSAETVGPSRPSFERRPVSAPGSSPEYLRLLLRTSPVSTLPPPA